MEINKLSPSELIEWLLLWDEAGDDREVAATMLQLNEQKVREWYDIIEGVLLDMDALRLSAKRIRWGLAHGK